MSELDPSTVLVVTGSHLRAEVEDRPLAYYLRDAIANARQGDGVKTSALVCSDLWYLNHAELRAHPVVSVGSPGVSALAAYFASRLGSVLAVDGVYSVQMEVDGDAPQVSCWGVDEEATALAVQSFIERHLDAFLSVVAS